MNYITEIKAFYDLVQLKQLSTGQIALWHGLMYINNKCAWSTWFTAPNLTLQLLTGLSRQAISDNRNVLKQLGLIDFKSNGTKATSYMLKTLQVGLQDTVQETLQDSLQETLQDACTLNKHKQNETKKKDTAVSAEQRASCQQIADLYNSICVSYPRVTTLSDARKRALKVRMETYGLEDFSRLFAKAQDSDFLKGRNNRDWKATFDWLIRDANMAKVLDGNYDNRGGKNIDAERKARTDNKDLVQLAIEAGVGTDFEGF